MSVYKSYGGHEGVFIVMRCADQMTLHHQRNHIRALQAMPSDIEIRSDQDRAAKPFSVWAWVSLVVFLAMSVSGVFRLVPFLKGADVNLLYVHIFVLMVSMRGRLPIWAYFFSGLLYDLSIGALVGLNAMILTCVYLGLVRLSDWGRGHGFAVEWSFFAIMMVFVEFGRLAGLVLFDRAVFSAEASLSFLVLHILFFPFAYVLLLPLKSRLD